MAVRAKSDARRERVEELRPEQDALLALEQSEFDAFCWDVATMRREPVPGLLERLRAISVEGEPFRVDGRVGFLRQAEQTVVDQLDREELIARLEQGRMTRHMCDYWEARRPKEVPRVNGLPIWVGARSVDVVD